MGVMPRQRLTIGLVVECCLMEGGEMHRKLAMFTVFAVLGVVGAGAAVAGQPTNQGCFGRDRAAYATVNGSAGAEAPGVGYYASTRAGDNGAINQQYKTS